MALRDALLPEFDREMAGTRKVLERVPEDKLGWKPHEKSGTLGWLAAHVARLPQWASMTLTTEELDNSPPGGEPPRPNLPTSRQELLDWFDKLSLEARNALANASDEDMLKGWTLLKGGQKLFTMPRAAVLRSFVMNHLIHHRGQLTVYLRMNGAPLPGLYGPSADEDGF
ncbi:MAG: DinB family protein [Acidobacteriaceae bacterium]